ncbi:MAG: hypothetical protein KJO55_05335, partial [Gammaproteobacteria bacterium]|nr:hypothetical protein [Gammaproteobacteria bacterium]
MSSFVTLHSNDDKILATEFSPGSVSDTDPFAQNRQVAFDNKRTRAGTVEFDGQQTIDHFPHWELVIVTSGSLFFAFGSTQATVTAGGALAINRGSRFDITARGPATWVFLSVTAESGDNPEPAILTFFDRGAELFASPSVDAEILVSPAPTCR